MSSYIWTTMVLKPCRLLYLLTIDLEFIQPKGAAQLVMKGHINFDKLHKKFIIEYMGASIETFLGNNAKLYATCQQEAKLWKMMSRHKIIKMSGLGLTDHCLTASCRSRIRAGTSKG